MSVDSALRRAAEVQAVEEGVTYDDIVSAQVGTSVIAVLTHYDRRSALTEMLANRRHARKQARLRRQLRRNHGYTVQRQPQYPF